MSEKRRAKYFDKREEFKLPLKYQNKERYVWKEKPAIVNGARVKKTALFDLQTNNFVVKNAVAASRPRMQSIAGNEFFPGLHEHVRMKVVETLKADFKKHFPPTLNLKFPILCTCELHTTPKYANWDLDNLWIYTKCFQDAMKEANLVYDDNIKYITQAPSPRFIPVTREKDRALIYTFSTDTDPRITEHLLYNCFPVPTAETEEIKGWFITTSPIGKPGDVAIDSEKNTFIINIGKKKRLEPALKNTMSRIYYQCVQMNIRQVTMTADTFGNGKCVQSELCSKGVEVNILKTL